MPPRSGKATKSGAVEPPTPEPPFWIADRSLPVGLEMGDGGPHARAFAEGDRVPDEHVQRFGWQDYVHAPPGEWPPPDTTPPDPVTTDESGDDAGTGVNDGTR